MSSLTSVSTLNLAEYPLLTILQDISLPTASKLYLVGGSVRDYLLTGKLPTDIDICVINGPAERLAKEIADNHHGSYVLLDAEHGIHRVVFQATETQPEITLDLADALENNLETDLARRDLTVNAMAMSLTKPDEIIDLFSGQTDLKNRIVRMVSEKNLLDDPLRMLRVFRFQAQLDGTLDPETLAVMTTHKDKLLSSAPERIHVEFFKLLSAEPCFPALKNMAESGLLEVILPELTPTRTVPPNSHHHLWLFDHSLELVHQTEVTRGMLKPEHDAVLKQPCNRLATHYGVIKLAGLLHDLGKPDTWGKKEDPKTGQEKDTFYGHEKVGEEITEAICQRWRLSKDLTGYLKKLVRWHLYPCHFGPTSARKSVLKFFRRMQEDTPAVVVHALADRLSTNGPAITEDIMTTSVQNHLWLLDQYDKEKQNLKQPPLLNGTEIMALLNLRPGKKVGELLTRLQAEQQLGTFQTKEEAEVWLKAQ